MYQHVLRKNAGVDVYTVCGGLLLLAAAHGVEAVAVVVQHRGAFVGWNTTWTCCGYRGGVPVRYHWTLFLREGR